MLINHNISIDLPKGRSIAVNGKDFNDRKSLKTYKDIKSRMTNMERNLMEEIESECNLALTSCMEAPPYGLAFSSNEGNVVSLPIGHIAAEPKEAVTVIALLLTAAHERIHFRQFQDGRLRSLWMENRISWKGVTYPAPDMKDVSYFYSEWENEANVYSYKEVIKNIREEYAVKFPSYGELMEHIAIELGIKFTKKDISKINNYYKRA